MQAPGIVCERVLTYSPPLLSMGLFGMGTMPCPVMPLDRVRIVDQGRVMGRAGQTSIASPWPHRLGRGVAVGEHPHMIPPIKNYLF